MNTLRSIACIVAVACSFGTVRAQTDTGPLKALPYSPSLDLMSLDRAADPCTDFYQYTCGGWQQRNPIPADRSSWDVYAKLTQDNLRFLWGLLAEAAEPRAERSVAQRQTGDYFAACMRQDAVDAAGATPCSRCWRASTPSARCARSPRPWPRCRSPGPSAACSASPRARTRRTPPA